MYCSRIARISVSGALAMTKNRLLALTCTKKFKPSSMVQATSSHASWSIS